MEYHDPLEFSQGDTNEPLSHGEDGTQEDSKGAGWIPFLRTLAWIQCVAVVIAGFIFGSSLYESSSVLFLLCSFELGRCSPSLLSH